MNSNYSDNATLINAIRNREQAVFDYIHKEYYGAIREMVTKNSGNNEDAEEIYSEGVTGLIVMLDKPGVKIDCSAITLFYSICYKLWLRVLTKRKSARNYKQSVSDPEFDESSDEQEVKNIQSNIFYECFSQLSNECRTIFNCIFKEMKNKDIAETMGMSEAAAYKKKRRCMSALLLFVRNHPDFESACLKADIGSKFARL